MTHIVFIISLIFVLPDMNRKCPFRLITFYILFLFLALRYDYGNDYMSYYQNYILINKGLSAWGGSDVLYKYLNLIMPSYELFIATTSFFYIITIYYFIKQNLEVNEYWIAVLLLLVNPYLFLVHLSSLRQTIAICIFIYAVYFAIKRKPLIYIVLIIIAASFHISAIILLPLYFVLNEKKIKSIYILVIYIALVAFIATPLFEIIVYKVLELLPVNYIHYFKQGNQNSMIATLIACFFFLFVILNINKLDGKEIIYGKLSVIATIMSILAYKLSMMTRVGMYFDIFLIITIPHIFNKIERKLSKQILFIIIIGIYLLKYYSFFNNPIWNGYNYYKIISIKKII